MINKEEVIKTLEEFRKSFLKRNVHFVIVSVLVFVLLIWVLIYGDYSWERKILFILLTVITIGMSAFSVSKSLQSYRLNFKGVLLNEVFIKIFPNLEYIQGSGFLKTEIVSKKMIQEGNTFSSNDLLEATYSDVHFLRGDVIMEDLKATGNASSRVTLFKGTWYSFEFNKKLKGLTQLRYKEDTLLEGNFKPFIFFENDDLKQIKLEHSEFNDVFDIYTNNQEEAFYILTPHFMDRILKLNQDFPGEVMMGFIENKLEIAYHKTNSFEAMLFSSVDEDYVEEVIKEARYIINIIDTLKLNEKLFKED